MSRGRPGELLSNYRLITIARENMFLDGIDGGFEVFARPVRLEFEYRVAGALACGRHRQRIFTQVAFAGCSFQDCALVQLTEPIAIALGFIGKYNRSNFHLLPDPIECDDS